MNKKKIGKIIKNQMDLENCEIDIDAAYKKVVSKMDFEEEKNTYIRLRKKVFIPIVVLLGAFLIGESGLIAYFLLNNEKEVVHTIVSSDKYIKAAEEYILTNSDYYMQKLPIQSNSIGEDYIFNIYKVIDLNSSTDEPLYFTQLYWLSDYYQDTKVILKNSQNIEYQIHSVDKTQNHMGTLNETENFVHKDEEVELTGYVNGEIKTFTKFFLKF